MAQEEEDDGRRVEEREEFMRKAEAFLRSQPPQVVEVINQHLQSLSSGEERITFWFRLLQRAEIEYKPVDRSDVRPIKEEPGRFGLMPSDTTPLKSIGQPK